MIRWGAIARSSKRNKKRINLFKCLSTILAVTKKMLLFFAKNAVALMVARPTNLLVKWASSLPEYHSVSSLRWIDFKAAYIHSDYSGLCRNLKIFTTKYSDRLAWEKIIAEYAALTGSVDSIKMQYDQLNRRRDKLVRIDALFTLARYNESYIDELLKFTSQKTIKGAIAYTKMLRATFNDELFSYNSALKKNTENETDPSEYFFSIEYNVSKCMGFNIVNEYITVKEMVMYIDRIKADSKNNSNGRQ